MSLIGCIAAGALLSWMLTGFLVAQPSLRITSPLEGTVVHPGESLTVTVEVSPPTGASQQVFVVGFDPIGFSKEALNAPPYRFTVQIPSRTAPKKYPVSAVGSTAPGHLVFSEPITIVVERADSPVRLRVQPPFLDLSLTHKGYLRVIGEFADGTTAELAQSSRVAYTSNAPAVATVSAIGIVTSVAPGSTKVIVTYEATKVEVPVTVRRAPIDATKP